MTNPYESTFGEPIKKESESQEVPQEPNSFSELPPMEEPAPEALNELIEKCEIFQQEAPTFAQLLSKTRAVDHQVPIVLRNNWLKTLVHVEDPHDQGSLRAERKYFSTLDRKFRAIIEAMKTLAEQHLAILKQFHADIDEHYYSVEKTDLEVKREIEEVQDSIILQRQILHDAQDALAILAQALQASEERLEQYINAGGDNNISAAEVALLSRQNKELTDGRTHNFNYTFFALNLLDKTSLRLGKVPQQTTTQYLQRLSLALEVK